MVDLDLWANCVASEFFPPEGSNVNPEYQWPFPTSLAKKPLTDTPVKIDGLKDAQEALF